ncbi:MAG TPA: DUF362 domain-containing protein [Methylomusa anaerophila]|uniref:DUF362 domain-containing protein n=1 Tax=Methylomusa anaerophila TaxID=1930071 RepID=A0A348AGI0_9FIRM|nr:DUF362 domain-containing protein [Methylomusa anaerophila]BBB90178.1 hypothetical protein MAMMFC1_00826 [Methylomusa anaerophila]HML88096.1 DUF362 domain-containing protein [Methylomusa anaerophila]
MDRREFIKYAAYVSLSIGLAGCAARLPKTQEPQLPSPASRPQPSNPAAAAGERAKLVVAEGTDPNALMDKGLKALGGIEKFIQPGNIVVIKPNFSVPRTPDQAATTNALLVAALVKQCLAARAKEVRVIDHTFTNGQMCLENSGMRQEVTAAGGQVYIINSQTDRFYRSVTMNGEILKTASYSRDVLDAHVFINFPILKHHDGTELTMGLKNLMGLVWDRGIFHRTDLNKTIAELAAFRRPHLTILDATRGITANGPMGPGPIREWNQVIFSTDMMAVDAYGANLFGHNPADIGHLAAAAQLGVGTLDWQGLEVVKV